MCDIGCVSSRFVEQTSKLCNYVTAAGAGMPLVNTTRRSCYLPADLGMREARVPGCHLSSLNMNHCLAMSYLAAALIWGFVLSDGFPSQLSHIGTFFRD